MKLLCIFTILATLTLPLGGASAANSSTSNNNFCQKLLNPEVDTTDFAALLTGDGVSIYDEAQEVLPVVMQIEGIMRAPLEKFFSAGTHLKLARRVRALERLAQKVENLLTESEQSLWPLAPWKATFIRGFAAKARTLGKVYRAHSNSPAHQIGAQVSLAGLNQIRESYHARLLKNLVELYLPALAPESPGPGLRKSQIAVDAAFNDGHSWAKIFSRPLPSSDRSSHDEVIDQADLLLRDQRRINLMQVEGRATVDHIYFIFVFGVDPTLSEKLTARGITVVNLSKDH